MKKLIVLLIALCLFGCKESIESKLSKLGYSQKDIEIIETYPENIQELFLSKYEYPYIKLMYTDGFDPNKLEEYMNYYGQMEADEIIAMVNGDDGDLADLYNNEYYLKKNKDIYLQYLDKYNGDIRRCIEEVNTKTYLDYYTDVQETDTSKNYLMLVNKYYGVPRDYVPDDLVEVEPHYGRGYLRSEVYEQYKKLQDEANELGYYFTICSAYREYAMQEALYNGYLQEDAGGVASVDTYSARPGHSEHHTGLCMDLYEATYGMDDFGLSEASKWVNENCYKYGFIIRYTKEKEHITGYQAEPWQLRYVGSSEIAKDIMDRGITFDEYYACFVEE